MLLEEVVSLDNMNKRKSYKRKKHKIGCKCFCCQNKRGEWKHIDNCNCNPCKAKRGELYGINHPGWKGGNNRRVINGKEIIATKEKTGFCEICNIKESFLNKKLCFDHDHKTEKFRGWLCNRCNRVLGLVKDNKILLSNMIKYLSKSNNFVSDR